MAAAEDFSCLQMKFAHIQHHVSIPYRHQTSESTPQDFTSNYLFLCYHTCLGRNLTYGNYSIIVSLVLVILLLCSVILTFVILLYLNINKQGALMYIWLYIYFIYFIYFYLFTLQSSF